MLEQLRRGWRDFKPLETFSEEAQKGLSSYEYFLCSFGAAWSCHGVADASSVPFRGGFGWFQTLWRSSETLLESFSAVRGALGRSGGVSGAFRRVLKHLRLFTAMQRRLRVLQSCYKIFFMIHFELFQGVFKDLEDLKSYFEPLQGVLAFGASFRAGLRRLRAI